MYKVKAFKSEDGRLKILENYRRLLKKVNFSYTERYVETAFGKTYLLEAGDADNPPIVLIHGSCSNSSMWFGEIGALSEKYHVYSVDIVGDAGNSEPNRLDHKTDEFADWLKEVFDGLSIDKAVLMGNSLGGWVSLRFASKFPDRIEKLVLIAPSGIVPIRLSFILRTLLLLPLGKFGQNSMRRLIFGKDYVPAEVMEGIKLIGENFNPVTGALPHLTDEQLRRLKMPILYIAGDADAITNSAKARKRLAEVSPAAEVEIIKNNGHVVYNTVNQVMPFLMKN